MKRKNKVRLVTVGVILFLCAFFPSVFYFFPNAILQISKLTYIFIIPCALFVLWPAKNFKIANAKHPKYSYCKWFGLIFIIELCIISIFILQNQLFLNVFKRNLKGLDVSHFIHHILWQNLGWNFGFIPWAMLAAVSAFFAYSSYKYSSSLPFSGYLFPKKKTFFTNEVKRVIDIFIQINTRLFVIIILSIVSFQIIKLFYPNVSLLTSLNAILVGGILLMLSNSKWFQQLIGKMEKNHVRQGLPLMIKFSLFIVITLFILFIYQVAFSQRTSPFVNIEKSLLVLKNSPVFLNIWNIGFWIMGLPLIGSLLIVFSHGRSIRQFILHVLCLPAALLCVYAFYPNQLSKIIMSHLGIIGITVFSAVCLILFLCAKDLETVFWLGFFPIKKQKKKRRVPIDQLYSFAFGILTLMFLINVFCPLLFFAIFGVGNFFIYLLFLMFMNFKARRISIKLLKVD